MGDFMVTDSERLHAAAESGMIGMKVGLESASPKVLKGINKPVNLKRFEENAETCYKLGIKTHGTITFGHPEDTRDTLNETLEFMKRSSLATWQVSVVTPFPGTPLYHWLKAAGRLKDAHGKDFNGNGNCIIAYPPESGLTSDYVEISTPEPWKNGNVTS
jgi:anaerobic magnesium-protoporphyrin IX monomethyl ester cyclase